MGRVTVLALCVSVAIAMPSFADPDELYPIDPVSKMLLPKLLALPAVNEGEMTTLTQLGTGVGGHKDSKYHIVSLCIGLSYCDVSESNMQAYADKHGYSYEMDRVNHADPSREYSVYWAKFATLKRAMEKSNAEYMFWMDADSLFLNREKTLESITDPSHDMVVAGDVNTRINSGHFLLKNNDWGKRLIKEAYDLYPNQPKPGIWPDQTALIYLATGKDPKCSKDICVGQWWNCISRNDHCNSLGESQKSHIKLVEQNVMNSYVSDFHKDPNLFILHLAGQKAAEKDKLMRRYFKADGETVRRDINKVGGGMLFEIGEMVDNAVQGVKDALMPAM